MYPHSTGLVFDISNNNGAAFDIAQAKRLHPDLHAVVLKLGEGASWRDPDFAEFHAKAVAAGLVVLPYWFGRPETQHGFAGGVAEARTMLADFAPYVSKPGSGIPVLDYESVADPQFAAGFVSVVRGFLKRGVPIVYCSASRVPELRAVLGHSVVYWIADYDVAGLPALGVTIAMWQFTDHQLAYPGAYVDASHLYVNPADLMLRGKQPLVYLDATQNGKRFARIRYGGGRVRAFLKSNRLARILAAGHRVVLRKQKGAA